MSRAPGQFAPAWLPRQQRRHIDRQLRKFFRRDACSVCSNTFKHNTRTAGGLNAHGEVVLAGECCIGKVAAIFVQGLYSDHQYELPWPHHDEPNAKNSNAKPTNKQIAEAIGLYQNVVTEADKIVDDMMRCGGDMPVIPKLNLVDSPWKDDDREWFEENPKRSHRMRLPFPGEADKEAAKTPAGTTLVIMVQQTRPGFRYRATVHVSTNLLPLPDDEAASHALFEAARGHESMPPDRQSLCTLAQKYSRHRSRADDA
jgi:hypothetical protein